jgi:hypothetical protein
LLDRLPFVEARDDDGDLQMQMSILQKSEVLNFLPRLRPS